MNPTRTLSALAFALIASTTLAEPTLIHNINGYTMMDGERQEFVALEFDDGVVTQVYETAGSVEQSTASLRFDGGGATMLPGLIDAHGHVSGFGQLMALVDLNGSESETVAAERVAEFFADDAGDGWMMGGGWNQVLWPTKELPSRQALDAVSSTRPILMRRVDGHAVWVNSVAFERAGITTDTPDPEGGQIVRDSEGNPTGVLIDNAISLLAGAMEEVSVEDHEVNIERGLQALAALGMTGVHDAGITDRELQAYRNLQREGRMAIRSYAMLSVLDPGNDKTLAAGPTTSDDHMLTVRSVKILSDGALGSRGAALHDDYSDQPGHRGLLLFDEETLRHHMRRSAESGFQVNVHAIGDLANTRVLDEFEAMNADPKLRALRHRIEHAQIVRPSEVARFSELDVIASIQPTHATSDKNMAGDRLGEERLKGAYAWQTLTREGARLAGGSDFPVEPPNPFYGLHAAVTRQDRDGNPLGGWRFEEALNREQSLSLFTEDAAYAGHAEDLIGRLAPGYAADFILVSEDFFSMPAGDIWKSTVQATVVGGELVFGSLNGHE